MSHMEKTAQHASECLITQRITHTHVGQITFYVLYFTNSQ